MKKLALIWGELNSELSMTQKYALRFVIGMAVFIFIAFLILMLVMVGKGKQAMSTDVALSARESFVFPKGVEIQSVSMDGKENFLFKVNYNKKDYLYLYVLGKKEPQSIVNIDYK